jgi:hypothetical protein
MEELERNVEARGKSSRKDSKRHRRRDDSDDRDSEPESDAEAEAEAEADSDDKSKSKRRKGRRKHRDAPSPVVQMQAPLAPTSMDCTLMYALSFAHLARSTFKSHEVVFKLKEEIKYFEMAIDRAEKRVCDAFKQNATELEKVLGTLNPVQPGEISEKRSIGVKNGFKMLNKASRKLFNDYSNTHIHFVHTKFRKKYAYLAKVKEIYQQRIVYYRMSMMQYGPESQQRGGDEEGVNSTNTPASKETPADADEQEVMETARPPPLPYQPPPPPPQSTRAYIKGTDHVIDTYMFYIAEIDSLENDINVIRARIDKFMSAQSKVVDKLYTRLEGNYLNDLTEEEEREDVKAKYAATTKNVLNTNKNLFSMYNNKGSIMSLITDSHFIAIYVLKIIHYGMLVGALYLTEKIFSQMYMQEVYANNKDPPSLITMYGIFLGLDIGFVIFLLTVMFLLMYIFKGRANNFIINPDLIKSFCVDFLMFTVILGLVMIILGSFMQMKKYFRYKTEGLRAIRAYKDISLTVGAVLLVIPFFSIF